MNLNWSSELIVLWKPMAILLMCSSSISWLFLSLLFIAYLFYGYIWVYGEWKYILIKNYIDYILMFTNNCWLSFFLFFSAYFCNLFLGSHRRKSASEFIIWKTIIVQIQCLLTSSWLSSPLLFTLYFYDYIFIYSRLQCIRTDIVMKIFSD